MQAPSEFCIYGFATALYTGPREKNLLQRITENTHAVKIKYYQIEVYEDAEIRESEVIPPFDCNHLPISKDELFPVKFTTEPEIHFKETVFDQINFIRDKVTAAYFVDPEITIITKKNEHTYGTIRGWGYFKIGNPVSVITSTSKVDTAKNTVVQTNAPSTTTNGINVVEVTPVIQSHQSIGCLPFVGSGLAIIFFLMMMGFVCNKCKFSGITQTIVQNETKSVKNTNKLKPTVLGERVVIPAIANAEEEELKHRFKPDSILVNFRKVPVPVSDRFQLLMYDYGRFDQDEVTLQFNDEIIEAHTVVPELPKLYNLSTLQPGNNYLNLKPTSDGSVGTCTPYFVLIRNGKIYFEKSFDCSTGDVKQIIFVNEAWE